MRDHCSGVGLLSECMRPVYVLKTSVLLAQLPGYESLAFALQMGDWQVLL